MESHQPYIWAPCPACWVCPVAPGPCGTAITTWGWGSRFAQTYRLGHISCANAALARGMGRGVNMGTRGSLLHFPKIVIVFCWYWFYHFLVPKKPGGKRWASCISTEPCTTCTSCLSDGCRAQAKPQEDVSRPRQTTADFILLSVGGFCLYFWMQDIPPLFLWNWVWDQILSS